MKDKAFRTFLFAFIICSILGFTPTVYEAEAGPLLSSRTEYNTGYRPKSVSIDDFNGDGAQDLATANNYGANVSVLLGNGDGTFQEAVNYHIEWEYFEPVGISVGDFDDDGARDLVVVSVNYGWPVSLVSIFFGNGDGTFQEAVYFDAEWWAYTVSIGDFDADCNEDLVIPCFYGGLWVFLGNGDGTFQPATSYYTADSYPVSVSIGDFDDDGAQDFAVANRDANNISILLGNGDGTFQERVLYSIIYSPESVAVGEFNGDGHQDLAVANWDNWANVWIFLGNGNGTFQEAQSYDAGSCPIHLSIGDLDADEVQDLAVANQLSNNVSVLLGNGDGTFLTASHYGVGRAPKSVAIGDFDDDGAQDLAVANNKDSTVSVLLNNGDGTFPGCFLDFLI